MNKHLLLAAFLSLLCIGCSRDKAAETPPSPAEYHKITAAEAAVMMEKDDGHMIIDVRRADEYAEGHIPGAVNIPNESIGSERPASLPDPGQILLVYCRSGARSKQASEKLVTLGYTQVYDFGGILSWTGETVSGTQPFHGTD